MSQQNLEIVRGGFERFIATGELVTEILAPNFVWDISHFHGWPEQQVYEGPEGAQAFVDEWAAAWDEWVLTVEAYHDAGEQIVALVRQRGRSKAAGMPVEMHFAQVFTLHDGREVRMEMYSDPDEALKATGLAE